MTKPVTTLEFDILDEEHRQIHLHLVELQALARRLLQADPTDADRQLAARIEAFFSETSRKHHMREEETIFPALLKTADEALTHVLRSLRQDHGFIEENWIVLGPQLRAVAEGNHWVDPDELLHNLEVFTELCMSHIEREERLIYPQAKAHQQAEPSGQ